jgi:Ca2+:H+ antiporter
LNATFGNVAELIIALIALHKGLFDVVKASLTDRSSATCCW